MEKFSKTSYVQMYSECITLWNGPMHGRQMQFVHGGELIRFHYVNPLAGTSAGETDHLTTWYWYWQSGTILRRIRIRMILFRKYKCKWCNTI